MQSSAYVKQFGGIWENIEDLNLFTGSVTVKLDVMRTVGIDSYVDVIVYKDDVHVRVTSTRDAEPEVTIGFFEKGSEDADLAALIHELRTNGL
jgi:hypothetical protein